MMDFGSADLEGLVGRQENGVVVSCQVLSDPETTNPKTNGSGFLKKERSGFGEQDWRSSKSVKIDDSLLSATDHSGLHQNMISFSSPLLTKNGGLAERIAQNPSFFYPSTPHSNFRNAGYGSGGLNAGMNVTLLGARGPFTPSQWVELEHQALIYKYMVANVPVPSNLLIALKKSLNPYGFSRLSSGSYAPNSFGWGSFHLGFSGNADPEPGRCRRTDGKKWRCSRDAVVDQKYCERHINRGRHRSRKHVESQTGQAVSGSTAWAAPIACSTSASVMSNSGASKGLGITKPQYKGLPTGAENPSADLLVSRMRDPQDLSMVLPTTNLKFRDSPFSVPTQHVPIAELSSSDFGLVSSDSLLNPSQKSTYINSRNYNSLLDFDDLKSYDQHPLCHFIDNWPKDLPNHATITWSEELQSDRTQLSIPMASSDFSSTSSSPPQEKVSFSPVRLSHGPIQIGTNLTKDRSEATQKQTNWIPIIWGSSMAGPLGEVLNNTSGTMGTCKNLSALDLTTGGWNGSPQLGSSPTGVLQKSTFVSLSNSSSGRSSPRADQKNNTFGSLSDDMLGSTLASSVSIPSL